MRVIIEHAPLEWRSHSRLIYDPLTEKLGFHKHDGYLYSTVPVHESPAGKRFVDVVSGPNVPKTEFRYYPDVLVYLSLVVNPGYMDLLKARDQSIGLAFSQLVKVEKLPVNDALKNQITPFLEGFIKEAEERDMTIDALIQKTFKDTHQYMDFVNIPAELVTGLCAIVPETTPKIAGEKATETLRYLLKTLPQVTQATDNLGRKVNFSLFR